MKVEEVTKDNVLS